MYNPQTSPAGYLPSLRSAAATLRVEVTEAPVRDDGEIERVITAMSERPQRRAYRTVPARYAKLAKRIETRGRSRPR